MGINHTKIKLPKEENIKPVKTIILHTKSVTSLIQLKDKRIASCSEDGTIRIFDPSNDYHCDEVIKISKDGIESICELDDGTIVSCTWDRIIIGTHTMKITDRTIIYKVIALPDNRIATCLYDGLIKIWRSIPPYSDIPIKVLEGHNQCVCSILYIKERDIMLSGSYESILRVWNMSTYQCISVIEDVRCRTANGIYQIDNNRVIIGGMDFITVFNIDKYIIENKIEDKLFSTMYSFLKLRDNKTILCGNLIGRFCYYDIDTKQYRITKDKKIFICASLTNLVKIDDNTFISSCEDKRINVWNY